MLGEEYPVEGRVPDPNDPNKDYGKILVGDTVTFTCVDSKTQAPIAELPPISFSVDFNHHYDTPEEMLAAEGEAMMGDCKTVAEAAKIFRSYPGYRKRITRFGIHAIGLGERIN